MAAIQTKSFTGKVALVTGGSRGIGAGIVRRLAADGVSVLFTYSSSEDKARVLVLEIESEGGKALSLIALQSRRLRPHGVHQRSCRLRRYSGSSTRNERWRPDRPHRQQHRDPHGLPWWKCLQHDQGCAGRTCSWRGNRSRPTRHHGQQCSARTHSH